ncbi:aminotransferase class III-fold pyridoxal phosphate-dependent enzyme [Dongia sedimenti]|uniref:Aminotransferase class III-fold pyridoxal phosphate-dependent enzyme n=1 Tax=Dongia sedimenti TaxID=3064282 RepID=A0ABU0YKG9_9PROT|nr:aminotransferase class III-fold pyridoxal phosphate-dependent enzyme [Rhodospirillaceae bacterium R-7]
MLQTDAPIAKDNLQEAERWLAEQFALHGRLEPLPGEHDCNFKVTASDGSRYLFKLHPAVPDDARTELQAAVLRHLEQDAPELPLPRLFLGRDGRPLATVPDGEGRARRLRLTTWLDGTVWVEAPRRGAGSAASLGRLLARLDRSLAAFHHPAATQPYAWDLANAAARRDDAALIAEPERRRAAESILHRFVVEIALRLSGLPKQVIHGDANDRNILLDAEGAVSGLIDFGDMVETWRVNELAVAAAYVAIGAADPIAAILPLVEAYCAENPIGAVEADVLFDLILTRYAVSMAMAARQSREQPQNTYLRISQDDVWTALTTMLAQNRPLAIARLRRAAGHEPVAARRAIEHWIMRNGHRFGPVLPVSLDRRSLTLLPLGADRDQAAGRSFRECLHAALADIKNVAVGRYGEDRSIYRDTGERAIHHAIDLYAPAGTPVLAPLPGRIAMIGNDTSVDGFGGILVLEHESGAAHRFWTFYGHLAPASLADKAVGAAVAQGAKLAVLGVPDENGNWPPHLHIQLMTALCFDRAEAIIGLSLRSQWDLWESLFPSPNGILGLAVETGAVVARDADAVRRLRDRTISPALSLSYERPLKIVAGEGAYLIAADGRRYLDMVNNVCHVGHCHPRVVEAITRQAARLNTNTRYLHDNLIEYTQRLARLLPSELSTVFLVNSGSEANDLALRLARAYTGGTDVMVLDHAYHGNLSSLIDISPYKFDGKGGAGRRRHVWVTEMPDLYRGRFRYGDADAGPRYAEKITTLLRDMNGISRRIAAFFVEAALGCGGQLVLPGGYLAAAFAEIRAAGGVCIADEVQIGFGRVGSDFWAFETQGVVPDIVTMGKPIGNGHPMGAVACRPEIAAAFANGMEYFNTFGGNPVSAAAGLTVLDIIRDERLMHNADALGAYLRDGFKALAERHALIGDIRGLGLFIGVELVRDRETLEPAAGELHAIVEAMKEAGVLLSTEGPHHNVLKIKPPLVITREDCDFFLEKLDEVMTRLG